MSNGASVGSAARWFDPRIQHFFVWPMYSMFRVWLTYYWNDTGQFHNARQCLKKVISTKAAQSHTDISSRKKPAILEASELPPRLSNKDTTYLQNIMTRPQKPEKPVLNIDFYNRIHHVVTINYSPGPTLPTTLVSINVALIRSDMATPTIAAILLSV